MAVITMNVFSVYVKQNMDVTVVLPDDVFKWAEEVGCGVDSYGAAVGEAGADMTSSSSVDEKLPCVWLYHGGSGDHTEWLYHTNLVDYVNERRIAAVLPNVHESCFVDMHIGCKYGTYVGRELPNLIHTMFRCISDRREDNYIAGFSNGGYGCLHVALRYPDRFCWVGAFSAGDKADAIFDNDGSPKSLRRIWTFGDGDLHQNKYGLTYMADRLIEKLNCKGDSEQKSSNRDAMVSEKDIKEIVAPKIYHACGGKDPWLWMNHIVRDYFLEHKEHFVYTYDEIDELGHEWKFWDIELIKFLDYVGLVKKEG